MEEIIKKMLGEQMFAVAMLQTKNDMQAKEIAALKSALTEKTSKKKKDA